MVYFLAAPDDFWQNFILAWFGLWFFGELKFILFVVWLAWLGFIFGKP